MIFVGIAGRARAGNAAPQKPPASHRSRNVLQSGPNGQLSVAMLTRVPRDENPRFRHCHQRYDRQSRQFPDLDRYCRAVRRGDLVIRIWPTDAMGTWRYAAHLWLLIGAYTLIQRDHVRVDILLNNRDPRSAAALDLLNYLFLVLWGLVLTRDGWLFFLDAWQFNELDDSALAHPMWPPKLALFVGSLMITMQGIVEALRSAITIINPHILAEGDI